MFVNENNILVAENLRKTYGRKGGTVSAVNDVSLTITRGEVLALLGSNGAGKTTVIKMISGLLVPDTGAVRINGFDPHSQREARKHIGSVLEGNRSLYWRMSSRENLIYFGVLKGMTVSNAKKRSLFLLDKFGLRSKEKTQTQYLSRGMQQRLSIAVTLMHNPCLLLLDEPTLGLDLESTINIKNTLRELVDEKEVGVLLTTHQMDIAEEMSNRVVIMKAGKVINSGLTKTLLKDCSNSGYKLLLTDSVDQARREKLERNIDAVVSDDSIIIRGGPEQIYFAMDILNPLCIQSVTKLDSDLGSVYLKSISEEYSTSV